MSPRRLAIAAIWLAAAALPLAHPSPYLLHIAILTGIYVLLVQSLNLVLGYCGLLSLATPAFFGIGAYVATLLSLRFGLDSSLTFAAAAGAGVVTAVALAVPSLRLSRHSFVIVTLSFTLLLQLIATNWTDLTRGALGLADIPPPRLFGIAWTDRIVWYYGLLAAAALSLGLIHAIVGSRVGRALIATRDNEPLAVAVGLATLRLKIFAFAVSGAYAGLAGAAYAHYLTYIDPGVFGFDLTESLLIMVILGGPGTLWGPVVGAIVFTALPEILRLTPELRSLLYGAILLAIVLFLPRGLLGGWRAARVDG
ncbi:MAG: branched-chain amino acid ABC transporter permease [Pseudomonadota bacterium]